MESFLLTNTWHRFTGCLCNYSLHFDKLFGNFHGLKFAGFSYTFLTLSANWECEVVLGTLFSKRCICYFHLAGTQSYKSLLLTISCCTVLTDLIMEYKTENIETSSKICISKHCWKEQILSAMLSSAFYHRSETQVQKWHISSKDYLHHNQYTKVIAFSARLHPPRGNVWIFFHAFKWLTKNNVILEIT